MTNNPPAYLWYPNDILSSGRVAALTDHEELWYRRSLDHSWGNEGMPKDAAEFAAWVGRGCTVEAAEKIIQRFYKPHKKDVSKVVNLRQEEERTKFRKKSKVRSDAGKRSGQSRREQRDLAAEQLLNKTETKSNISISISSSNKEAEEIQEVLVSGVQEREQSHLNEILDGLRDELNLISLSNEQLWCSAAEWAFLNNFTSSQFLECFRLLRGQNWRKSRITARNVMDNLPELDKLRAKSAENVEPDTQPLPIRTEAEKLAAFKAQQDNGSRVVTI